MTSIADKLNKWNSIKHCFVPACRNNTNNAPGKLFLNVPRQKTRRRLWCEIVGVRTTGNHSLYCCENHFDCPEDIENYTRLKLMGEGRIRLKSTVVPHKNLHPSSPGQEQSASKIVHQCQIKGIQQTNLENLETVNGCQIVKISCKRTGPVTCEKQNNGKLVQQMNAKCLKIIEDCASQFTEKDYVQNDNDNTIILQIADPNNILSNLHDLTDKYSAVITQVIDKNDINTYLILCKNVNSEQMNNETIIISRLQETDDDETILPDVAQKNMKNEWTMDSEIDICEFKIKMEESETDTINIKLEPIDGEALLSHVKQEQVDACLLNKAMSCTKTKKIEESS